MKIKEKHIFYVGAFIVLTIIGVFLVPQNEEYVDDSLFVQSNNEINKETIFVHIIGEVNEPGIKEVPKYTRVFELIELSGGLTANADVSRLNLASVLKDEQKIVVPAINREVNIKNSENNISTSQIGSSTSNSSLTIIDINNSSKEELITLPGIGASMAQKIIDYRENNGLFSDIEEIKNVSRHRRSKI